MTGRGHFSKGVIQALMEGAGGLCSNPSCRRPTIGPSATLADKSVRIGEAAHIKGAQPNSARYDATQTDEERHGIQNGIWLCSTCAALVDKNHGADFPVATLKLWKLASKKSAGERLLRNAERIKEASVGSLIYINVPRLMHFAYLTHESGAFPRTFEEGIPGDRSIVVELHALERAIAMMEYPALSWQETISEVSEPTGMLVSFEGVFRTKNGPRSREALNDVDMTSLRTAPHIYCKDHGVKFVLPYDPRFVTTNTATVEFGSGHVRVGGFAQIKKKTVDGVWASPLFIGLWTSPEARAIMEALAGH